MLLLQHPDSLAAAHDVHTIQQQRATISHDKQSAKPTFWKPCIMLDNQSSTQSESEHQSPRTHYETTESFHRITDVLKCKWTLAITTQLAQGTKRPSEIQSTLPGLTSKVLTDRLKKLESFDLIERQAFPEVPPRVEYTLTSKGEELSQLLSNLVAFINRWDTPQ